MVAAEGMVVQTHTDRLERSRPMIMEGAIANQGQGDQIRQVRDRTQFLIALGDGAVTGLLP